MNHPHLLQKMAPARARAAASEYLCSLITGEAASSTGANDLAALPPEERTPRALIEAITPGERATVPWFVRSALADVLGPATQLLARRFPLPFHRQFCQLIPVEDFRATDVLFAADAFKVEPLSESYEIKTTVASDATFEATSIQPRTVARVVKISRELIHADTRLGYFSTAASALLRAAYQHEASAVFTLLESGATLPDGDPWFDATNSVSAASVPTTLEAALGALASQSIDGECLDLQPGALVIPATWGIQASDILADVLVGMGRGSLQVFRSGRVTAGYLFADPAVAPAVGLAGFDEVLPLLDTRRGPSGSAADSGLEIRVRHDYGTAPLSRRGIVKMTITA